MLFYKTVIKLILFKHNRKVILMNDINSLIFYIILFGIACLFMYFSQSLKIKKNKSYLFFLVISFLIPLVVSGLRFDVGTDYFNYIRGYDLTKNMSIHDLIESNNIEFGFFFIRKISSWFNNYQLMFWISTFITLLFFYLALFKHKDKLSISLGLMIYLFVFFPSSLNIVRQHIALAIITYSYRYIFERDLKKFSFFCLIASSFHITALIVLPFYFIFSSENNLVSFDTKKKAFFRFLIIIISVIFVFNFTSFIKTLSEIDSFEKFGRYAIESNRGVNREIFLKGLILFIVLILRKKLIKYDSRNKLYIYFLIIDLIITFVGFSNPFVKRIGLYFGITEVFLLPSIVKIASNKMEKYVIRWGIILYSIVFFILAFYLLKQSNIIPYNINTFYNI